MAKSIQRRINHFNKELIISQLNDSVVTRSEILQIAQRVDSTFKPTQLKHLLGVLADSNALVRIGRDQYKKTHTEKPKTFYEGWYSERAIQVIEWMKEKFPLLEFQVWDLNWLNEFINHLIARSTVFLEIERVGYDFVFYDLQLTFPGEVLLAPDTDEYYLYAKKDGIVINPLITEPPKTAADPYQAPLEKIIVDLFTSKFVLPVSEGDLPFAFEEMFSKYYINQVAMMRYARRRNVHEKVYRFLKEETQVELTV